MGLHKSELKDGEGMRKDNHDSTRTRNFYVSWHRKVIDKGYIYYNKEVYRCTRQLGRWSSHLDTLLREDRWTPFIVVWIVWIFKEKKRIGL